VEAALPSAPARPEGAFVVVVIVPLRIVVVPV
jgi:hypothetical protein